MGVLGLWKILESVGHPIKLDGLEGKRLGVDANIWLYKFIRGFRERENGIKIDSHKLCLVNYICKLLYYKIRPIFVFDGPAPILKRRTIERRQRIRIKQLSQSQNASMKALATQLKQRYPDINVDDFEIQVPDLCSYNLVAAQKLTDDDRDLFEIPNEFPITEDKPEEQDERDEEEKEREINLQAEREKIKRIDARDIDVESEDFAKLPAEIRYEVLVDIRDSRKRIRRINNLPEDAGNFSNFQMQRLRARRTIQEKIEKCEEEICSLYYGDIKDLKKSCREEPKIEEAFKQPASEVIEISDSDDNDVKELSVEDGQHCRKKQKLHESIDFQELVEFLKEQGFEEKLHFLKDPDEVDQQEKTEIPVIDLCDDEAGPSTRLYEPQPEIKRLTNRVTNKIVEEAKEILRLFCIPYVDAAGEAEAQCALLESCNLTEGTITDDSDIWLFGAKNVYRHFFSDEKYVTHYKMMDIEFHLRMTRENLVSFAMLVGSDYTEGIMNVGPVTALEILSEFPGDNLDSLIEFKKWKEKFRNVKSKKEVGNKKREQFLKLNLPSDFPSMAVYNGYLRPVADEPEDNFTWGMPELDEVREYTKRNLGWDEKKADEKLLPVMKRLYEKKTQKTIDSYFKIAPNLDPDRFKSKRVNRALNKIIKKNTEKRTKNKSKD